MSIYDMPILVPTPDVRLALTMGLTHCKCTRYHMRRSETLDRLTCSTCGRIAGQPNVLLVGSELMVYNLT